METVNQQNGQSGGTNEGSGAPSVQTAPATVGQGDYTVRSGDCMDSIAYKHGFFWKTLWELPENAELKKTRKDANVLLPGDLVTIPDLRQKELDAASEQLHRFRRRGVPARLRLRFFDDDEPRAGEKYILEIDGTPHEGELSDQGELDVAIPPDAKIAILRLGEEPEVITLDLGTIDPITEPTGVHQRLNNLGFKAGSSANPDAPEFVEALRRFQAVHKLDETGRLDQATRDKVLEIHGS